MGSTLYAGGIRTSTRQKCDSAACFDDTTMSAWRYLFEKDLGADVRRTMKHSVPMYPPPTTR
nr:hypothetical protein [uncultured Campylobacter sp.]